MWIKRRSFLRLPALLGLVAASKVYANTKESRTKETIARSVPTPSEGEGPFYPLVAQADQDFDLTQIAGKSGTAQGEAVFVQGRVLGVDGEPLSGVTIDLWQANAVGRYRHPFDKSDKPLDENFQGWAIIQSGKGGGFRFRTIVPGAYDVGQGWTRPPHLHFKVSKRGFIELTTQMYFSGQTLNDKDLLLKQKSSKEQQAMIASPMGVSETGEKIYQYDIVLAKV